MRLSPVLLAAAAAGTLGVAAHSVTPSSTDFTVAHSHELAARSPLTLSLGGFNICIGFFCNRPSKSWKCNGTGRDGYSIDYNGHSAPSWTPRGWLWFGADIGWAPARSWSCGSDWAIPSAFGSYAHKVTWWKPSGSWISKHSGRWELDFSPPPFWGIISWPSQSFKCNGSGKDGFEIDCYGKKAPSWVPAGWRWFGVEIGWAPLPTWSCGSDWTIPSAFGSYAHKVTWWKPSGSWISKHSGQWELDFSPPPFWGIISWPSQSFKCNGSGKDGFEIDCYGKKAPSWVPAGWRWFGVEIGWAPLPTWSCDASWTVPSEFIGYLHKVTWWKPSTAWIVEHSAKWHFSWSPPSWWGISVPVKEDTDDSKPCKCKNDGKDGGSKGNEGDKTPVVVPPPKAWKCDGSGKDGHQVDWQGKACPSHLPKGWLWYGVAIGWAPSASWTCDAKWSPSSLELEVLVKVSWWLPPKGWLLPAGFKCPLSWTLRGWIDERIPSRSFDCDGSGNDGFDFDFTGSFRPSHLPLGWKYFGLSRGWQPCASFALPSASWQPPAGWDARRATWWTPRARWTLRGGFRCPSFWGRNFLRGEYSWY
ncbi:hypothetical protein Rhopal_001088-T1 [Rhodotorula paludigena]|uniref:Proteophosphoglycan ppg4 n=1 Tax=Rhodotorula paludigena TaxID=86838 RepID=A0AAV5GGE3_9BASI|nr:hypothetical protein Rhopal_001088-T1 [Rhodotorula paludigena]